MKSVESDRPGSSRRSFLLDALILAGWSALPSPGRPDVRSSKDLAVYLLEEAETRVARTELTEAARLLRASQRFHPGPPSLEIVQRYLRSAAVIQRDTGQGARAVRTYRR